MNTNIKAEKRTVEFKLITRECLAFLGIWVQLSQTLTATNLEAILLCTPNHWERLKP